MSFGTKSLTNWYGRWRSRFLQGYSAQYVRQLQKYISRYSTDIKSEDTLLQKSYGREEKLTLKSSSNNSIRSHQDSFHTNYKFGSTWHDLDDDMSEEDILQVAVTISLETVRNNFITEEIHFTKSLKYLLSNIILCD